MSETPQRHTHSGPGDGGTLPDSSIPTGSSLASDEAVFKQVATGSVTVADSTSSIQTVTDTIGVTDRSEPVAFSKIDLTSGSFNAGANFYRIGNKTQGGTDNISSEVFWSVDASEWKIEVVADGQPQLSFDYTVYKINV